nr:hypothetical protein [Tanacetum cinerariifolium]
IMLPKVMTRSAGRPDTESQERETGGRVGRGSGRGRRPRECNDEGVDDLNGQRNDQVCKTRNFALGDKPHSFFAPERKPPRRGLNPRPLACVNNLPKVTLVSI